MSSTTVYGSWTPVKDEPPCNAMEVWPSMRAAERCLRERLAPPVMTIRPCSTYYVSKPRRDDEQFYGSEEGSGIYLYETPDADEPHAMLEFGPRGGIRKKPIVDPVDEFVAHMASRDPQELEADRAAAWGLSFKQ